MIYDSRRTRRSLEAPMLLVVMLATSVAGCEDALEIKDPLTVLEERVNNPFGANMMRNAARVVFFRAVNTATWDTGVLADEFWYQQQEYTDIQQYAFDGPQLLDKRASLDDQEGLPHGSVQQSYGAWQYLRGATTTTAMEKLMEYGIPGQKEAAIGEVIAFRAYGALRLAQDHCPGFPLNEIVKFNAIIGKPQSTQSAFEYAVVRFDSAMTWAADSARVLNFARLGKARALINLGRYADAATAVKDVPTSYVYNAQLDFNSANELAAALPSHWEPNTRFGAGSGRSVADREGGVGLNYASAGDPRVPVASLTETTRDGKYNFQRLDKYPTWTSPIPAALGIEARLIEAEAALNANNASWLSILNDLRATKPGLAPLADPGVQNARVDLLFRERAFWLFGTGSRLGDMRRLVRVYGRSATSVFPSGAYWKGGTYGPLMSLPIDREDRTNFGFWCTGNG